MQVRAGLLPHLVPDDCARPATPLASSALLDGMAVHATCSTSSTMSGMIALGVPHLPLGRTRLQRRFSKLGLEHRQLLIRGVAQSA